MTNDYYATRTSPTAYWSAFPYTRPCLACGRCCCICRVPLVPPLEIVKAEGCLHCWCQLGRDSSHLKCCNCGNQRLRGYMGNVVL